MCWYVRVLGPLYRSRVQRLQVGDVDFRGLEGDTEREENRGTHERTIERTAPVYFNKGGARIWGPTSYQGETQYATPASKSRKTTNRLC